uniref:Ceroid-lipofuscinosis neuronal protein 6 homolog n=1 Tax=Echeneis naucrates TaxID=173247 RepID=A0A665VRS6_ECHNA
MQTSARKRHAATAICSRSLGSAQLEPVLSKSGFYLDLWLVFTVQSWTLDVGRSIVMVSAVTVSLSSSRYVPLFLVLLLFFSGCFCPRRPEARMPPAAWMLLVPNAAYYWYIITEGQTFILFIFTFFAMAATVMHQRRRDLVPDGNGLFMLYSFSAALVLVAVWVACLWGDPVLRRKHPGLIYVPQPRAFYSLHLGRVTAA